jgi:predicted kinase
MLVSLSGLPGTGKSTIACLAARELGAVYLRVDTIERPMFRAGFPVEAVGYEVAQAVASDNLELGRTVIADCVNPWPLTRDAWRQVGHRLHVRVLEIEFVCSDATEHRRRVESRHVADSSWPSWQDVLHRDYRAWERERVVIDTATITVEQAVTAFVGSARNDHP